MKWESVLAATFLLLNTPSSPAQTFLECADVNGNGYLTTSDIVQQWNEHFGGPPVPVNKGDIDFRQGYTIGDSRYLLGFVFRGWPEGGCPPFAGYPMLSGSDTLLLPSVTVPAGSGSLALPLILKTTNQVTDLLLPLRFEGLDGSMTIDSLRIPDPDRFLGRKIELEMVDSIAMFYFVELGDETPLVPGLHQLGMVYISYSGSSGGPISMDTTTSGPHTFPNYLYAASGNQWWSNDYALLTLGVPTIVHTNTVDLYPMMSAAPDSLRFDAIMDNPDPPPQSFTILSDGAPFAWTITTPWWIDVDKTSGISGETVSVQPHTTNLATQLHRDQILVHSDGALSSPLRVIIEATVRPAFPSLDANCDGVQNAVDVIILVNYLYKSGTVPCNPCTGEVTQE